MSDYAFPWLAENGGQLFDLIQQQVQDVNPILGALEFEEFKGLTEMPQGFASAWHGVEKLTGASYTPLYCVAKQQAKGTNYWFIAGQTLITATPEKNIVTFGINEFNGNYTLINGSIVRIF